MKNFLIYLVSMIIVSSMIFFSSFHLSYVYSERNTIEYGENNDVYKTFDDLKNKGYDYNMS